MSAKYSIILLMLASILNCAKAFPLNAPFLSPTIKKSTEGYYSFLRLWEYALGSESEEKIGLNIEPKTLLLPGDHSMAHLVPQDGAHPLYKKDVKHSKMRMEFILDHLVLNLMPHNHPDIVSPDGLTESTLSGKPVTIRKELSGDLFVEGVKVKKIVTFSDDYHIYVLKSPLFNQTQKVREAFNQLHQINKGEALGPPLIIPGSPLPARDVREPAPPPCGYVRPPSPPSAEEIILFHRKLAQPPPVPFV